MGYRMSLATAALLCAACTPPSTNELYTPDGERVEIAYLVLQPLCALFCNTSVTTSGSKVDTRGNGATGGSTSNTQSTTQSGIGSN